MIFAACGCGQVSVYCSQWADLCTLRPYSISSMYPMHIVHTCTYTLVINTCVEISILVFINVDTSYTSYLSPQKVMW